MAKINNFIRSLWKESEPDPEPFKPDARLYDAAEYLESILEDKYEF